MRSTLLRGNVVASAVPVTLSKRLCPESSISPAPHPSVRLDRDDAVAVFQEQPGEDALPRCHIRDHGILCQAALAPYKVEQFGRIGGTIPGVVFDPAAKALRGVGHAGPGRRSSGG